MEKRECSNILKTLAAAYPTKTISKETAAIWAACIADKDYKLASETTVHIVKTSEFFPSPARWLAAYHARQRGAESLLALPSGPVDALPRDDLARRVRELKKRRSTEPDR